MEVDLYVYDLSKGLAKQLSLPLLGIQIEAVYHTAIVCGGVEYLYGHGVQTCLPGSSHHGQPMEVIPLGKTSLPGDIIEQYLESLKEVYTVESYDLFLHNCNNFSNDFATFLVGQGIPSHITSLPQTVLNTPFGQMLKPQLDQAMRSVTQAPLPPNSAPPPQVRNQPRAASATSGPSRNQMKGVVRNVSSLQELKALLHSASKSCAVIFFTSSTCPPCKLVYPTYDELAAEAGNRAVFIKVDIGKAYDVASRYGVRATPTFITFLKGDMDREWTGADEAELRGNVSLLLQMAKHPHKNLDLPLLSRTSLKPITFAKPPPLGKLMAKMGTTGQNASVISVKEFVAARSSEGAKEATLPDMHGFSVLLQRATKDLPAETMFTVVDLLRAALVDPRFSGYFAEETQHKTMVTLLRYVNELPLGDCPYALRLVTLQATCNLFSSPLYPPHILLHSALTPEVVELAASSLRDDEHANVRVAASSLFFNIAAFNYQQRSIFDEEAMADVDQVELLASLLDAISKESSADALHGLLLATGLLVRGVALDDEVAELVKVLDARGTVAAKGREFPDEGLVKEVGEVLLGRGFEQSGNSA